jgi:hypothetical protein
MSHNKAVLRFAICLLAAPLALAQYNTAWPAPGTNANVGIGTASPDAKLQVAGGSVFVSGDSGALTTAAGAGLALKYYNGNALIFGYDYSTSLFKNLALQTPGGNVTIGWIGNVTSPSTNARVIVAQGDGATGLAIANFSGLGRLALNGNSDGSWTAYDNGTGNWTPGITQRAGNVGIGNVPFGIGYPLDAYHYIRVSNSPNDATSDAAGLILSNRGAGTTNGEYSWHIVTGSPNQTSGIYANGLEMWEFPNPGRSYGCCLSRFIIKKASDTVQPKAVVIDSVGHVGIGGDATDYNLDVTGTIHATQVIGAVYQDVAEWVPATAKMSPGTVVVVQRGAKNTVMPSAAAYATSVAGVVSEKPGVILGESSDSNAMIATTGRVKVHVDASSGAIEAGDLLVTSGRPGMAMKSQPVDLGGVKIHRPGTLIGKALESLPRGEGDILVLLSLQ